MKRYILFISIISLIVLAGIMAHGYNGPSTSSYAVGSSIVISDTKTTLADADYFAGLDSENGNALTRWSWANIKAALVTYFDTLYFQVSGYAQVDTESELAAAIASATPVIVARADITFTSNHTIVAGQTYSAIPGAVITTNYSVAGGGSNWTVHSGSVYVSTANYSEIEFLRESGTALTEVAGAADVDAAGKWAWEADKIYVWTTGSVDPDTLGAGLLVAGHTLTFATGSHLEDNGGQMFDAAAGEVIGLEESKAIWWYSGTGDFTNAAQSAVSAVLAKRGTAYLPSGVYTLNGVAGSDTKKNGILFPWDSNFDDRNTVKLKGTGSTKLKAGSTDMVVIRVSQPYVEIDDIEIDGDNLSGVTALGIIPEDTGQTTTQVSQSNFVSHGLVVQFSEVALDFQPGPAPDGQYSGCFFHKFYDFIGQTNKTHVKLSKSADYASHENFVTRTAFFAPKFNNGNCGIYAEVVGDISFHGAHFQLINAGLSPLATPTAIYAPVHGTSAHRLTFFGGYIEGCTRDFDTANTLSILTVGMVFNKAKIVGTASENITYLNNDELNLSYDAPGANGQIGVDVHGGLTLMSDPSAAQATTVTYIGQDNVRNMAISPFLRASNMEVDVNGNYHSFTSDNGSNATLKTTNTHATTPSGHRITFSAASPNNTTQWFLFAEDATKSKFIVWSNGDVVNRNNSYGALSDRRLKTNIIEADSQWDKALAVQWREFSFLDDPEGIVRYGVIADELEAIFPDLVTEQPEIGPNGIPTGRTLKAVNYSGLSVRYSIAAHEMQNRLMLLESRVVALENK